MKLTSRKLSTGFVGAALAASMLVAVPSASHAAGSSLLAGDSTLAVIACNTGAVGHDDLGKVVVNPVTLEFTEGTSSCGGYSFNSVAYNAIDGRVYAVSTRDVGSTHEAKLANMQLDGTQGSAAVNFTLASDSSHTAILHSFQIAINPLTGDAYIFDTTDHKVFTIDLTTGQMTQVNSSFTQNLDAVAYSPDGNLYGIDGSGNDTLVKIDTSTWAVTNVQTSFSTIIPDAWVQRRMYGMAFDSNGTLFITSQDINSGAQEIWALSSSNNFATSQLMNGSNPNADPNNAILAGTPWSTHVPGISGSPIIITFGLQKVIFNTVKNGGTKLKPGFSRFMSPTILATAGLTENPPVTLPAPDARTGYTFDGWFDAAKGGTKIGDEGDTYVPAGTDNITFYAQWTKNPTAGGTSNGTCSTKLGKVKFGADSAKLTKAAKKKLRTYAKKIQASGCTSITLKGYTATTTNYSKSAKADRVSLSKMRNAAVAVYLNQQFKKLGVKITIKKQALGASKPVASNKKHSGRAKNRRVEIILAAVL